MDKNKLIKLIERSGFSVNEIQSKADMKSGALYRLLSGKHKDVTLSTAFRLADALGVDVNEFREEKVDESITSI